MENKKTNNTGINWEEVIDEVVSSIAWFKNQGEKGIKPSLRTMHYRLASLEVIPNTSAAYKTLSDKCVKARKLGLIPWDCFSDEGRYVIGDYDEDYLTPEEHVQWGIDWLKNAHNYYTIPRWHNQKYYVEVWLEKSALADTFKSFLEDRDVKIAINKGYAGWSFIYDNCQRLKRIRMQEPEKEIHVLYYGDLDPSGEDMDRHLLQALAHFGLDQGFDIYFQRIAITEEQIKGFGLPSIPRKKEKREETLAKLEKDSRTKKFKQKHSGKLYAVELDALLALRPDEFKAILQKSVDRFFNEGIYRRALSEHSAQMIQRLVRKKIKFKQ